jgi:crotonobetainyl-CoA:carnitine CoA-transferase CaiB-like acyl-CoA transferase
VIGRQALLATPEYATHEARSKNYDQAYKMVAEELKKRTTAEWLEAFERADIPVQRMNSLDDIVADPHLAAIGYLKSVEHPTEGRIKTLAVPSEWSESTPEYRRHAPRLGEHTREVLREAGFGDADIEALLSAGAARQA